jgi:hypothetical protein
MRAVHDPEATFGDHAFHVVGAGDHVADDPEDVFSHRAQF